MEGGMNDFTIEVTVSEAAVLQLRSGPDMYPADEKRLTQNITAANQVLIYSGPPNFEAVPCHSIRAFFLLL